MSPFLHLLAQINEDKIKGMGEPPLEGEYSYLFTWIIAGLLLALILLVTFKPSKRNVMERE